jgi:hypothetical protein
MMNTAGIVPILLQSLHINDSFSIGAQKIASFIRKTEERYDAAEVIHAILNDTTNQKTLEYTLFAFLDICRADFDILEHVIPLRQMRRLISKLVAYPAALTDQERMIADQLREELQITTIDQVVAASRKAATLIVSLSHNSELTNDERTYLQKILTYESSVLKARSEWLSEHVDSYNMKKIARLLPLLTVCDEQTGTLKLIVDRMQRNDKLGRALLTFENAMHGDYFEKWKKKVRHDASLTPFLDTIQMQKTRLIPIRSLVAVATLSRRLHSADAQPLVWISHALNSCTTDGFRMDIGSNINAIKKLLASCNIVPSGSIVSGSFASDSLLSWIGTDMLTRGKDDDEREPSPKELVMRCMANDALLLRLLENPKVAGAPGLIALIASTSRSLAILQKIAMTKELYSGYANNGVPLALLKNPTRVPLSQIRQFINSRYVSFVEMKEILHNPYGVRQEIFSEIKAFIDQRYK